MDIASLITSLIGGLIGGNAVGASLKDQSLGTIGNTIAGIVGGVAGTWILQAVGILHTMGVDTVTVGSILGEGASGIAGGAVLTAIIGYIKNAMGSKS